MLSVINGILLLGIFSQNLPGEETPLTPLTPVLREHEVFKRQYSVTNPFERAVRVERIDTSCTCITQKLHKYFLLPGESTLVDVEVANTHYSGNRSHKIWLYVTDPEYEAIELQSTWSVSADIAVDLIKEDSSKRPDDKRYRDIYRYVSTLKPNEGKRLKKYIRMYTPDTLDGGLQITSTYTGSIWKFTNKIIDAHTVLVIATARDPKAILKEALHQEKLVVTSNHPHKKSFVLEFITNVDIKAGTKEQKKSDFNMPLPMPMPK